MTFDLSARAARDKGAAFRVHWRAMRAPPLRSWTTILLVAAGCGTTGTPDSAAPAPASAQICGLGPDARKSLGLSDDQLRASDLVLRAVDERSDGPMAGVVLVLTSGNETIGGSLRCQVTTDRSGLARTRVVPGLVSVATLRGDLVIRAHPFYVSGRQEPREIAIERAAAVSGHVLDERGKPLAKVAVTVFGEEGSCTAETDAAGAYRCTGLWSGEHSVTASVDERAPGSRIVLLGAGAETRDADLTLHPGAVLIVRANCGGPCVGATIGASVGDEVREERVGADGTARLRDLPPGEARVYGFRNDLRTGKIHAPSVHVRVQSGKTVNATLELGRGRK
jgi:hypothetical protein